MNLAGKNVFKFKGFLMVIKANVYFAFVLVFFLNSNTLCMNFLLQEPKGLGSEEKPRTITMCFGDKYGLRTFGYNKASGVFIKCEVSNLSSCLNDNEKKLFSTAGEESIKKGLKYQYIYGVCPEEDKYCGDIDYKSYLAGEVLKSKNCEEAQNIDCEGLAKFIKTKSVLFYTGAGISASAGIFTMNQLKEALGLIDEEFFDREFICKLENSAKVFEKFCYSMENTEPSKAHKSLLELANYKKCIIVTENLDSLHQKTGIEPYIIFGDKFRQEVKSEWAKEIDAIICCGLSHDDRGFLGWYKKYNSEGVIVAIDLGLPNYLGDKDFILNGDIQDVIPRICLAVKEHLN